MLQVKKNDAQRIAFCHGLPLPAIKLPLQTLPSREVVVVVGLRGVAFQVFAFDQSVDAGLDDL